MERFGDFIYMHRCTPVLLQCQHQCAPDFSVLHWWTGAVLKDAGASTPVCTTFHSYTPVCWCGAKKIWCKHTGAWWIFSVAPVLAPVHEKIFPLHQCAALVWCAILVHTTSLRYTDRQTMEYHANIGILRSSFWKFEVNPSSSLEGVAQSSFWLRPTGHVLLTVYGQNLCQMPT